MTAAASKGNKCAMFVRGIQLVDQASRRLFREGVSHGVRMNQHWNKNYGAPIQLCSIDTLIARNDRPPADLIVIDEAHLATSEGYKAVLLDYPKAFVLAVTATPYGRESLEHLADTVVAPISMQELIDQGYLVPPRYFAPSTPDLKGVRTRNGDYESGQLEERMSTLTGDIVTHWKALGEGRPTILFAVNIQHSKHLVAQFNSQGIAAEHVEAVTPFEERQKILRRLETGDTKIVSNVGILCTGVDLPYMSCIIMARPTQSYNLFVQQLGRGTRTFPGKQDFVVLDHAGNVMRHGFLTNEPEIELSGTQKREAQTAAKVCEQCFAIYTGSKCHACSFEPPVREASVLQVEDGILQELREFPLAAEISLYIRRINDLAKRRGYKAGFTYHAVVEKYGKEAADAAFPWKAKQSNQPWFLRKAT